MPKKASVIHSPLPLSSSTCLNVPVKRILPAASTSDAGDGLKTVEFLLVLKLVTVRGNR